MTLTMQYKQTLKMQFYRSAGFYTVIAIMQIIISLGIAIGFTYLFSDPEQQSLLYLATGAPTIVLLMTGLVLLPVHITNNRSEGYDEFLRTLPVNRAAILLADTTIWLLITLPGILISILVTNLMFAPGYAISPWFLLVYLLCGLACVGVGYGYANALPPTLAMSLSQVIAFVALMFSPINFPMSRLPVWLQAVHTVLPLDSMAKLMRSSLAVGTFEFGIFDMIKVSVWCILGFAVAIRILNKK